jgi:hypothetical protein
MRRSIRPKRAKMRAILTLWEARASNRIWSGTKHDATKVPVLLASGLGRTLQTGRVLDEGRTGDERRKLCGVYLGIMDRIGVKLECSGDASERLAGS